MKYLYRDRVGYIHFFGRVMDVYDSSNDMCVCVCLPCGYTDYNVNINKVRMLDIKCKYIFSLIQ